MNNSLRLEDDLHLQFPHLESINKKQFNRPGYIELYELEKMKEDPELASIDSDVSDPTGIINADDKYDLAAVRKGEFLKGFFSVLKDNRNGIEINEWKEIWECDGFRSWV